MRLSPKRMSDRVAATLDRAAAGSEVPAGQDPAAAGATTARERGVMRRRVRRLRRVREVLLHELGALVFEMERRGRRREALLRRKVDQLRVVDDEAAGLAAALGGDRSLFEIVSAGIVGACRTCGTLVSTDARFCSNCATPVSAQAERSVPVAAATPPAAAAPGGEAGTPADSPPATATLATGGPPAPAPSATPPAAGPDEARRDARPGQPGDAQAADTTTQQGLSREAAGAVPQRASDPSSPAAQGAEAGADGTPESDDGTPEPSASVRSPASPESAEASARSRDPLARG